MSFRTRRPFNLTLCVGFLFGLAIATLMLGISRMGREGGADKTRGTPHSSHSRH